MAATLDKDTLVKHSFWILAGCYVVLVLACLAVLMTSVSDAVRKEDEALQDAKKKVESTPAVNGNFVTAYSKQDEFVNGKKVEVWKKAWETQKDMMTWPRSVEAEFQQKYKYFGEPIGLYDRGKFQQAYAEQFKDVREVVQPVTANGEGVVQCKGDWGDVLQLEKPFQTPPTKDDIWLAQEELWVKREMLRIIREANDSVARFKEVIPETAAEKDTKEVKAGPSAEKDAKSVKPETAAAQKDQKGAGPPAAAKTDPNHKIFRNPYWEFDLTLEGPTSGKYVLSGKITNISKRKQPLDTKFKVFLQDPRSVADPSFELLSLADLPLAAGQSKQIKNQPVSEQKTIERLFGVEQVLDWRTAAVKRLDDLRLMYHSSRTAVRTLKPPRFINTNPTDTSDTSGSGDATSQTAGAATPGGALSPYGVPAAQTITTTLSGLEIDRYADVSEQVRHMPVAMVVVVDEEHLPELLAAFVNSKLRIQITQYHWQHCRDRMKPLFDTEQGSPLYPPGPVARGGPSRVDTSRGPSTIVGGKSMPYGVRPGYPGPGGERSPMRPGAPGVPYSAGRMPAPGGPGPTRPYGPMGPTMRPPVSPGLPGTGSVSDEDEEQEDLNLLEVAVYGLASLYERYPPAPPKPAEQGTPEENKPATGSTGGN